MWTDGFLAGFILGIAVTVAAFLIVVKSYGF